jgi:hypothetical protein
VLAGNGLFLEICVIGSKFITSVSEAGALLIISLIKLYHGMRVDNLWGKRKEFCKSKTSRLFNVAI